MSDIRAVDTHALIVQELANKIDTIGNNYDIKMVHGYIYRNDNVTKFATLEKNSAFDLQGTEVTSIGVSYGSPITRISPIIDGYYDETGNIDISFVFDAKLINKAHSMIYYIRNSMTDFNNKIIEIENPADPTKIDKWSIALTPSPIRVVPEQTTIDGVMYLNYNITINVYLTKGVAMSNERSHYITRYDNYDSYTGAIIDESLMYQIPTVSTSDVLTHGIKTTPRLLESVVNSSPEQAIDSFAFTSYIPNETLYERDENGDAIVDDEGNQILNANNPNPILTELYNLRYSNLFIGTPYIYVIKSPYIDAASQLADGTIVQRNMIKVQCFISGITINDKKGGPDTLTVSLSRRL